jgi:hypothetical protein
MAKGEKRTIAEGNRDFAVSIPFSHLMDNVPASSTSSEQLSRWKPKTIVGDGIFLWNIPLHGELSADKLQHNLKIMRQLSEAALKGKEK